LRGISFDALRERANGVGSLRKDLTKLGGRGGDWGKRKGLITKKGKREDLPQLAFSWLLRRSNSATQKLPNRRKSCGVQAEEVPPISDPQDETRRLPAFLFRPLSALPL
jgi:hypothetical protein